MNELLKFNNDNMTVSARDLHELLNIETPFHKWFPRMCEYGFSEDTDFWTKMSESTGGRPATDYDISIEMAKEICMIQRTAIGKKVRQYFIDLEKAWNTPEQVMARALKVADQTIHSLQTTVHALAVENASLKPKAEFFDAVTDSKDAIDMKSVANVLNIPGIGRTNLFKFLREAKILMPDNRPYQEYIDRGYFRTIEQRYDKGYGEVGINIKTLVFQKGVDFIRKKLKEKYENT